MITKKDLKNYLQMNAKLTRLEEKLTEMRHTIEKPRSAVLSDMPKGGMRKDFTDNVDNLLELQEVYNRQWDALIDERIRIESAIAKLSDPVECAILGYKYIDGLTWEQVCVKINYSWVQTHAYHSKALKNIAEL